MKKVLVVAPFLPYPFLSGGHQAIYNGLMAIPDNVEIYLTYPSYPWESDAEHGLLTQLNKNVTLLPFKLDQNSRGEKILDRIYKIKYLIKRAIKGEKAIPGKQSPYEMWLNQLMPKSETFIKHINRAIDQYAIDIVQCEMLESLSLVLSFPQKVKTIFVHHELGFIRKSQHPFLLEEPLAGNAHVEINRIIEVNLLNRYNQIITLSSIDTKKLQDAGVDVPIHTSFAIVNTPLRDYHESTTNGYLSFVGPEWHPSNKEGLLWFLSNCWEDLLLSNKDYSLRVIGNWTEDTKRIISSRYQKVEFMGYVEDLENAIKDTIMIVPITIGSGIRMKILEACMIGVPVVTTSIGKEGLPLVNGEHCCIADSPFEFVKSIESLSDPSLRGLFVKAAQNVIKEQYSLSALKKNREPLYE